MSLVGRAARCFMIFSELDNDEKEHKYVVTKDCQNIYNEKLCFHHRTTFNYREMADKLIFIT